MATKTASLPSARSARKPVLKKRVSSRRVLKEQPARARQGQGDWPAREKSLAQVFGPPIPKGKVLLPDGEAATPLAGSRAGLCLLQFAPRPDRLSWVYASHGLSEQPKKNAKVRTEIYVQWRQRDTGAPVRILARIAAQLAESGHCIAPGEVITSDEKMDLSTEGVQHWLVCAPDKTIAPHIDCGGGKVRLMQLLGISDAELQFALKVKPELADGRRVLAEALRNGGVFPVTDPARTCLTRRRDFNRLWENAFRAVRKTGGALT